MNEKKEIKKEDGKIEAGKIELDPNDLSSVTGGGNPFDPYTGQDNKEIDSDLKNKV